jgi:hypothetical protein
MKTPTMDDTIKSIAHRHLDTETLETRRVDSHDFRIVAVWNIKAALEEAYRAGQAAAKAAK